MVTHIFIKISQNVCLIDSDVWYIDMPDVIVGYGRLFELNAFVCEFYYMIITIFGFVSLVFALELG